MSGVLEGTQTALGIRCEYKEPRGGRAGGGEGQGGGQGRGGADAKFGSGGADNARIVTTEDMACAPPPPLYGSIHNYMTMNECVHTFAPDIFAKISGRGHRAKL